VRETRAQAIVHHINLALGHGMTMRSYATDVARLYKERTGLEARSIDFHETRNIYADERANAQIVQRFIDGRSRMPIEIEEALVLALPDPFRGECKRELAARYGDLAAPIPSSNDEALFADTGKLMEECGRSIVEISQSVKNGLVIDPVLAMQAVNDLQDTVALATTLREHLHAQLGVRSLNHKAG
jgi:hypothetical protein